MIFSFKDKAWKWHLKLRSTNKKRLKATDYIISIWSQKFPRTHVHLKFYPTLIHFITLNMNYDVKTHFLLKDWCREIHAYYSQIDGNLPTKHLKKFSTIDNWNVTFETRWLSSKYDSELLETYIPWDWKSPDCCKCKLMKLYTFLFFSFILIYEYWHGRTCL